MAKRESKTIVSKKLETQVVALAERVGRMAGRMQKAVDGLRAVAPGNGRSGGNVDAPGKKHRKAPNRRRGVKHSDQAIAKVVSAKQTRPPRRG